MIVSLVTSTRSIRDSTLTAVLIPCLNDDVFVLQNHVPNLVEFTRAEPMIPRELDWRQPKLAVPPIAPDVNGFVAVETVEKEPVRPRNTGDPRHSARLHPPERTRVNNRPANNPLTDAEAEVCEPKACGSGASA